MTAERRHLSGLQRPLPSLAMQDMKLKKIAVGRILMIARRMVISDSTREWNNCFVKNNWEIVLALVMFRVKPGLKAYITVPKRS